MGRFKKDFLKPEILLSGFILAHFFPGWYISGSHLPFTVTEKLAAAAVSIYALLYYRSLDNSDTSVKSRVGILALFYTAGLLVVNKAGFDSLYFGVYDYSGISSVIGSFKIYGSFFSSPYYVSATGNQNFLAHHFSPTLILLVPFYTLINSHIWFGVFLAAGFAAFMLLYDKYLQINSFRGLAGLLVMTALLFHQDIYIFSISAHFEIFTFPLAILLFIAMARDNTRLFWASLLLLFGIKEDISLYFTLFGIYLYASGDNRRYGRYIALSGIFWFIVVTRIIMPAISGESESRFLSYWGMDSLPQLLLYWLKNPGIIINSLAHKQESFFRIFAPLLFIPLINPLFTILVILPLLFVHFVSDQLFHGTIQGYYPYTLYPFILYILPFNLKRAAAYLHNKWQVPALIIPAVLLITGAWAASAKKEQPFVDYDISASKNVRALIRLIPPGANVHTHSFFTTQLRLNNPVWLFSDFNNEYQYILIEPGRTTGQAESAIDVKNIEKTALIAGQLVNKAGSTRLYYIPPELRTKFKKTLTDLNRSNPVDVQ